MEWYKVGDIADLLFTHSTYSAINQSAVIWFEQYNKKQSWIGSIMHIPCLLFNRTIYQKNFNE